MLAEKIGLSSKKIFKENSEYGAKAWLIDQANLPNYKIPEQIRDEIPTLSKFGYMKVDLDYFGNSFIENAKIEGKVAMEIGCAYGLVVHKALAGGATMIAADISEEHLISLLRNTPEADVGRLYLQKMEFPQEMNMKSNLVDAVLVSRVLHFFGGEVVEKSLDELHRVLRENGKLYLTLVTPYHASFKEFFLKTYQERAAQGEKYPGVIDSQWEIAPQHKPYVPPYLNVFDVPQLEALLPRHGFEIEEIKLFDYPNDTYSEGRGHVGLIARKV